MKFNVNEFDVCMFSNFINCYARHNLIQGGDEVLTYEALICDFVLS